MSRSRAPLFAGLAVAGGVGYYLYAAGGSPKVAEKQFEHDIKSVRDRATASGGIIKTDAEKYGAEAGAKLDSAVAKAQAEYNKAAGQVHDTAAETVDKASAYTKDVRSQVNKKIDAFDKTVEDAASKTKSGVSSWFGGK